jgi:SAM-dependent methyltransferase
MLRLEVFRNVDSEYVSERFILNGPVCLELTSKSIEALCHLNARERRVNNFMLNVISPILVVSRVRPMIGKSWLRCRQVARRFSYWAMHHASMLRLRFTGRMNDRVKKFSEIYYRGAWGPGFGEHSRFFSGGGSHVPVLTEPYVQLLCDALSKERLSHVIDIGCGDFAVGRRIAPVCQKYLGIDIVPELVSSLRDRFSSKSVEFACLDVVTDAVPHGDICLIRQVLQHLSNEDILRVLEKLRDFDLIVVTEHLPDAPDQAVFNADIESGAGIRLCLNSGVYVDKPPFRMSDRELSIVLELPVVYEEGADPQGVLRTTFMRKVKD